MPTISVRYVGDVNLPANRLHQAISRAASLRKGFRIDFEKLTDALPDLAADSLCALIDADDTAWKRFDVLVLDMNYRSVGGGELAGFDVYDKVIKFLETPRQFGDGVANRNKRPRPWKQVYISTIWRETTSEPHWQRVVQEARNRGIPEKFCYGSASDVHTHMPLATAILNGFIPGD